ncbi:MAG TPA: hypothetical protein VF571_05040 [Pyrinomonadaceae bacterium]|jgi:DNA-binding transcriptional regulator GbsR (MarR family)
MSEEKNNNLNKVKESVRKITGEESKIIAVPIELIHFVGDRDSRCNTQKALFLAQLIYWSDKSVRTDKYVYKTYKEWAKETGLSSSQIASYAKEFERLGFLNRKLKKANGNPTIYYKIEMDVFLNLFKEFLENRYSNNLNNGIEETEESLTENTTEITTENTTDNPDTLSNSTTALCDVSLPEDKSSKTEENVNVNVSKANASVAGSQQEAEGKEEKITLPADFSPNLEYQYRAVISFYNKSPREVTEKFINYYKDKTVQMSPSDWNNKWWEWMRTEKPFIGYEEQLKNENNKIILKVMNMIYGYVCGQSKKIIHVDAIYRAGKSPDVTKRVSEETIDDCLKRLVDREYLACLKEVYYFSLKEYLNSEEWRIATVAEAEELGLA